MSPLARTNLGLLVLRVGIGLIAMFYGAQKMLGVFGGVGIHETVKFMKNQFDIPPVMAILAMVSEFLGGLGMVVGLFTNIAAFGFTCTMAVATYLSWRDPALFQELFKHGTPSTASAAFYTPALFVAGFGLTMMGGGAYSLDQKFFGRKKKATK